MKAALAVAVPLLFASLLFAQSLSDTLTTSSPSYGPTGPPSAYLSVDGGGNIYFSGSSNTQGTASELINTPAFTGTLQFLPYTITQIVVGTPGCNNTNRFELVIPPTATNDSNGKSLTVSANYILTKYYSPYKFAGCHWEFLQGETKIVQ